MCQLKGLNKPPVGVGLFYRIEVLALDVLDNGQLERLRGVDIADLGGHGAEAGGLRGPPASLAGDDLERAARPADHDGLNDAVLAHRQDQLLEGVLPEVDAWLRGAGLDVGDGDVEDLVVLHGGLGDGRGLGRLVPCEEVLKRRSQLASSHR